MEGSPSRIELRRSLGRVRACSYIVGTIIGAGIFITPQAILAGVGGSMGLSFLVWLLCALLSYLGALCYAEIGGMLPVSGAPYSYVRKAFGDQIGFWSVFTETIISRPMSIALSSLSTAEYLLRPAFLYCPELIPIPAKKCLGISLLLLLSCMNYYSVNLSARLQVGVTACKLGALMLIIVTGLWQIGVGHTENFTDAFVVNDISAAGVAGSMLAGLYTYLGWDVLNTVTEEIKNPKRNLPLAIFVGLTIPTIVFLLTNVAYHAVLTNQEILSGVAVGVLFAEKSLGQAKYLVPIFAAISIASIMSTMVFVISRMMFVAGRNRNFPRFLSMINKTRRTPQPAILLTVSIGMVIVIIGDVGSVLGAYSFFRVFILTLSILAGTILRRHHQERDFKIHILIPIAFLIFMAMILIVKAVGHPIQILTTLAITGLAFPCYYVFHTKKMRFQYLDKLNSGIVFFCQQVMMCEFASATD